MFCFSVTMPHLILPQIELFLSLKNNYGKHLTAIQYSPQQHFSSESYLQITMLNILCLPSFQAEDSSLWSHQSFFWGLEKLAIPSMLSVAYGLLKSTKKRKKYFTLHNHKTSFNGTIFHPVGREIVNKNPLESLQRNI